MNEKHDRRSGSDRRQGDLDSPNGREKRRRVEQRKPEMIEAEMSEDEWTLYFGKLAKGADKISEEAASVFDRNRN